MSIARKHYAKKHGFFYNPLNALAQDVIHAAQNFSMRSDLQNKFLASATFLLSLPVSVMGDSEMENNSTTATSTQDKLSDGQKAGIAIGCMAGAGLLLTLAACCAGGGSKFCDMTLNGRRAPERRPLLR